MKSEKKFPDYFPFWARLKIDKNRTTLVIDEIKDIDKKTGKVEDLFVHREATHTKGHVEEINPNPDKNDIKLMYLLSPRVHLKYLFVTNDKNLDIPEKLRLRYEINNQKEDSVDYNDTKK